MPGNNPQLLLIKQTSQPSTGKAMALTVDYEGEEIKKKENWSRMR